MWLRGVGFSLILLCLENGIDYAPALAQSVSLKSTIAGIRAARGKLNSGEVRIYGTLKVSADGRVTKVDDFRVHEVFDCSRELLRCDRTFPLFHIPQLSRDPSLSQLKRQDRRPNMYHAIYCRTPSESFHYLDLAERLVIGDHATVNPSLSKYAGGFLDPRAVGLYNNDDLFRGRMLEDILAIRFDDNEHEFTVENQDKLISVVRHAEDHRWEWTIDPDKGFAIIRVTQQVRIPEIGESEWRKELQHERYLEWELFSDVWLPVSYRSTNRKPLGAADPKEMQNKIPYYVVKYQTTVWSATFDWQNVNQPINDASFRYQQFDLPIGTPVYDNRLAQNTAIDVIGKRMQVSPDRRWATIRTIAVVLNVALIAAIVVVLVRRRCGKERSSTA